MDNKFKQAELHSQTLMHTESSNDPPAPSFNVDNDFWEALRKDKIDQKANTHTHLRSTLKPGGAGGWTHNVTLFPL